MTTRAGDPAARRHRRRGARPRPRDADLSPALAAQVFVCRPPLETPTGPLPRASRTSSGCCASRRTTLVGGVLDKDIEPLAPGRLRCRGHPPPGDLQPGRAPGRRRRPTGCSARSPSTTCSTTCCPRTGARRRRPRAARRHGDDGRGAASGARRAAGASRRTRSDQPLDAPPGVRPMLPTPQSTRRRSAGSSERFARFMGTRAVPRLHDRVRRWSGCSGTPSRPDRCSSTRARSTSRC